jgi:ABC-2 type transport system ATP-binding protein
MFAIEFNNLVKIFGSGKKQVTAVKDLNLQIAAGQVYGFLGPNGAGKTTTIRMMMDLIRPTHGSVQILRHESRHPATLKRVGALVEGPAFYGYLSGRDNLRVLAHTRGCYADQRIDDLLKQVDLAKAADRKASSYSLGMKQRLGLAAALLHNPDLVILDEPTNGLDPAGILEMRTLIRDLAVQQGKTVFISSHLLNEVEQICDRVAIVSKGEIVREGPVQALVAGASRLRVDAHPPDGVAAALGNQWPIQMNGSRAIYVQATRADVPMINQRLVAAGLQVYELTLEKQSLEDYFLAVTAEEKPHA